jgi:hypothetical protein
MTPKERKVLLDIIQDRYDLCPLVYNLASSKFGLIYIHWLHKNLIFGPALHALYLELGATPRALKEFILKNNKINYRPSDVF